jgi:hypothetical protein
VKLENADFDFVWIFTGMMQSFSEVLLLKHIMLPETPVGSICVEPMSNENVHKRTLKEYPEDDTPSISRLMHDGVSHLATAADVLAANLVVQKQTYPHYLMGHRGVIGSFLWRIVVLYEDE